VGDSIDHLRDVDGRRIRELCRSGALTGPTAGMASGYTQVNLVVLPSLLADDFDAFCRLNRKPCPLLERTDAGEYEPRQMAPGADLRTDLPRYRVYRRGELVDRPQSVETYWREDFVSFLIGCSFTFEWAMLQAGLPVRHVEENRNVPMYRTNIACAPAGPFHGPMVVSMRPLTPDQARQAVEVTSRFERVHGAPVQIGEPDTIGIKRLDRPDYGDAVTIRKGEIPVFWACGVTPVEAIIRARPEVAITHEPGHMLLTDVHDEDLRNVK
jgi:uncharacterized protein YcsI (UPF0317 family)